MLSNLAYARFGWIDRIALGARIARRNHERKAARVAVRPSTGADPWTLRP